MTDIAKLVSGFRSFKATTFERKRDIIRHLIEQEQKPTTLVISSCDLQISPAEIFSANPGEFFILNNIGGMVPKYKTQGISGILSALEYAVINLEVETILVLNNAHCTSTKLIMSDDFVAFKSKMSETMKVWLSIASEARDVVKQEMAKHSIEEQEAAFEKESLVISLNNLLTYPYIKEKVGKNKLKILGWQFDVETGDISAFNPATGVFEIIN
ncbi:MAG: carbonic anhydrase [Rickettsiales bacterium]